MVGFGEQDYNHASFIFITAVTNNIFKISENSKLVVGSGGRDYNYAYFIFIAAVTKNVNLVIKIVKIVNLYFQNWWLDLVRKISNHASLMPTSSQLLNIQLM